jgi:hypothetical protein
MRSDFAALIEAILGFVCALTGHFRGCWLLNKFGPTRRLHNWSVFTSRTHHWDNPDTAGQALLGSSSMSTVKTVH